MREGGRDADYTQNKTWFSLFLCGLSHSLGGFQCLHFTLTHDLALKPKQLTATFVTFYTIKLPGLAFSIQLFIPSNFIIKMLDGMQDECDCDA